MSHSYTLQLHTGSFTHKLHNFEEIKAKTERILAPIHVKDVIIGWNTDKELNRQLITYFHNKGIRTLLWLPALAEGEQLRNMTSITNVHGAHSEGVVVNADETFQFACPCNLKNAHHLISIYEEYFADIPFDGIFLDKIRFPSFANGYEEGFGCFCDTCEKQMIGIDLPYIKSLITAHDPALVAGTYDEDGIYRFEDAMVHAFYKRRANMISDYVFKLAAYFNSRKMIVGADVYAPFMAYHVGQNLREIGKLVDFIKPMFYRYTNAPAGMQYEYDAYVKNFDDASAFAKHWDGLPASDTSMQKQLNFLSNMHANVCAGIEINPISEICTTDKEKIKANLQLLSKYSTVALCWDIMQMDETILDIL